MRRLIINADDFGLTSGVNRGILESHHSGIVTSATLMACGDRFAEAADLARQAPQLSVGCHVVLLDGKPVLSPSEVPTLSRRGSSPHFRQSLAAFACLAVVGRLDQVQIEAEITAQIQKLQAAGISVSHLDTHKHTHMLPVVMRAMLRAARTCGVRAMRNPFEPLIFATLRQWKRHFQLRMMSSFRARFRDALAEAGMATPDGCLGIAATGGLTLERFEALLRSLPEGTWEFVSHPGYNDPDLDRVLTRLRDSREKELRILISDTVKELLKHERIQPISYRELL